MMTRPSEPSVKFFTVLVLILLVEMNTLVMGVPPTKLKPSECNSESMKLAS